jgi:hypothetical protein
MSAPHGMGARYANMLTQLSDSRVSKGGTKLGGWPLLLNAHALAELSFLDARRKIKLVADMITAADDYAATTSSFVQNIGRKEHKKLLILELTILVFRWNQVVEGGGAAAAAAVAVEKEKKEKTTPSKKRPASAMTTPSSSAKAAAAAAAGGGSASKAKAPKTSEKKKARKAA